MDCAMSPDGMRLGRLTRTGSVPTDALLSVLTTSTGVPTVTTARNLPSYGLLCNRRFTNPPRLALWNDAVDSMRLVV
jgi:hypothetical protein